MNSPESQPDPKSAPQPDHEAAPKRPASMGVLDHLEDLRRSLFWLIGLAIAGGAVAWGFSDAILEVLLRPAREAGQETLYFSAPLEAFMLKLKASAVVGLLLTLPLMLQRAYSFILPGLMPVERRVVSPLLWASTLLFYVGVTFCFFLLLPMVVRFAMGFSTESLQPWLGAGAFFALAARLCLAFGLLFELPVVVFALSWAGVVHPKTLLRGWRYALLGILVASALLTPPDLISQLLLAGPVMLLYTASVLIALVVTRGRNKDESKESSREGDEGGPR